MTFLRILIAFVLVWYLAKVITRWITGTGKEERGSNGASQRNDYTELTDQAIEDAEYEDIEKE